MEQPQRLGTFQRPRGLGEITSAFSPLDKFTRGSRFAAYLEAIESSSDKRFAELPHGDRAILRHAIGECMEALDIFEALSAPPPVRNWEKELWRIFEGELTPRAARHFIELGGSMAQLAEIGDDVPLAKLVAEPIECLRRGETDVTPEIQQTEEAPRNAAFELWLARLFRRANLLPQKAEPDWVLPSALGSIAVAAKRVQSLSAAYTRLEDAAAQVESTVKCGNAVAGIAAIDLTLAYDLHRKHWVIREEVESTELHSAIVATITKNRERVQNALRGRTDVKAVALHAKAMVFVRETQRFLTIRPVLIATVTPPGDSYHRWCSMLAASIA